MIRLEEFQIPSSDSVSNLHCVRWIPEGRVRATVQISHGMIEHIKRYHDFAIHLAEEGIAVYGHDHLGHGSTGKDEDKLGFFAEKDGRFCLLKDLHRIDGRIRKEYPDIPHFMLGHSMGSFFARRYLTLYGAELDGMLIMGTGNQPLPLVIAGKVLASIIGIVKGKKYRSPLMHNLVLGGYNRHFEPTQTKDDWLSRNQANVLEYIEDPYCNFYFTCGAYGDFFHIILDLKLKRQFDSIPRTLPIYILSGAKDPVGDFGRGPEQVYRQFLNMGLKDVNLKLYPEDRHELLNEIDREMVYEDIASWIFAHLHEKNISN